MNLKYSLLLLTAVIMSFSLAGAQAPASQAHFVIGPRYIRIVENQFILVRRGHSLGAFVISGLRQDSGGLGSSLYTSYFQEDFQRGMLFTSAMKQEGEIQIRPMKGFHIFAWQPGRNKLMIGPWRFGCLSPSLVNMSEDFSEKDQGYEFAPTSARNISEVNADNKTLRWYRLDKTRQVNIPVDGLSK